MTQPPAPTLPTDDGTEAGQGAEPLAVPDAASVPAPNSGSEAASGEAEQEAGQEEAGQEVTAELVTALLRAQHPDLADLPVEFGARGWDSQLWRLGDDLAVRLPWATGRGGEVIRAEYAWVPGFAGELPLPVPVPQRLGEPGELFPHPWTVTTWVPGLPADKAPIAADRAEAAADALAAFLTALHRPAPEGAPVGHRGGSLVAHTPGFERMLRSLVELDALTLDEVDGACEVWADAVTAPGWTGPAVWLHTDLHAANVLTVHGELRGVIDFGDLSTGDPAADLAAAWLLLPGTDGTAAARCHRAYQPEPDADMLRRARGWALLSALGCLSVGEAGRRGRSGGKLTWGPPARAALHRLLTA